MLNTDKCRVCLSDGAKHAIFENIESKDSVYSKLFQCFQEKIEDIEGFPRNICELCYDILNTIINFITNYRSSCQLLQSNVLVKKESCDSDDEAVLKEEFEVELCKEEPEPEWIESIYDVVCKRPLAETKKQEPNLIEIKEKLKGLKEINFKRKPTRKNNKRTSKIPSSKLRAKLDSSQESSKSSSGNEQRKLKPRDSCKSSKLVSPNKLRNKTNLCDVCGDTFKDKHSLDCHQKSKHFDKPFKCPECKKVFIQDYNLKAHIRRVHGIKTLECDTCGRKFTYKGDLNNHVKNVHLKIRCTEVKKKHTCELCHKAFALLKGLIIHTRSVHTGERPAVCTVCDARFYHEEYLQQHMRLHTGETPYKCPICSRGYAQRGNLRSHISHNHRLEDLSPELIKTLKPHWFKYLKKP